MLSVPVSRLQIGDTVEHDGAERKVHALHESFGRIGVYFTDRTHIVCHPDDRLDVTAFRPATDAEFKDL